MRNPTPAAIARTLRQSSRDAGAFDAARYFRGDYPLQFYNVGTAAVRALARDIYRQHRATWTIEDAMRLADALMRDPYLEAKSVGLEIVARFRRGFTPSLLPRWKRWLAGGLSANWATTDAICGMLVGPLLVGYPSLVPRVRGWSRDRNLWVRRASAVALIPPMRRGLGLAAAYEVAGALHGDANDLIQKAVGWMLREAGKQDEARLERYLLANGPVIPRTTLRYAIERFPARKRAAVLAATRAPR